MSFLYERLPVSETDKIKSFREDNTSAFNYGRSALNQKTGGLEQVGGAAREFLKNFEKKRERESVMDALFNKKGSPFGGAGLSGRTTSLADGSLTQISPDSFEPIVFPGGGGGVAGGKSSGQRLAGGLGGAMSGFQAGASTGIPHLAGIGAVVGGIGGLFG